MVLANRRTPVGADTIMSTLSWGLTEWSFGCLSGASDEAIRSSPGSRRALRARTTSDIRWPVRGCANPRTRAWSIGRIDSIFRPGRRRCKEAAHDPAICVRTEMPRRTSRRQRPLQPRNPTRVCQYLRYAPAIDTRPAQLEERQPHRREHLKRRHTYSAFRSPY